MKQVKIRYFALLRDERALSEETIETSAETLAELYADLSSAHGFSLGRHQLRVAVNNAFVPWENPLSGNDTVVFIPPVAGG